MLFINDDQSRLRELNRLFQQSMRTDDELRIPLSDMAADLTLAVSFQ